MTKLDRQIAASRLAKKWDTWLKMSDADLLAEVKATLPIVSAATRDECLKFLTMDHVMTHFRVTP